MTWLLKERARNRFGSWIGNRTSNVGAHLFYKTRYHGALGRLNKLLNNFLKQNSPCNSSHPVVQAGREDNIDGFNAGRAAVDTALE